MSLYVLSGGGTRRERDDRLRLVVAHCFHHVSLARRPDVVRIRA
jgi:hypothetical protein